MSGSGDGEDVMEARSLGSHFSMRSRVTLLGASLWAYGAFVLMARGGGFSPQPPIIVGLLLCLVAVLVGIALADRRLVALPAARGEMAMRGAVVLCLVLGLTGLTVLVATDFFLVSLLEIRSGVVLESVAAGTTPATANELVLLLGCALGVVGAIKARHGLQGYGWGSRSLMLVSVALLMIAWSVVRWEGLLGASLLPRGGSIRVLEQLAFWIWVGFCASIFFWKKPRWRRLAGLLAVSFCLLILASLVLWLRGYPRPEVFPSYPIWKDAMPDLLARTSWYYLLLLLVPICIRGALAMIAARGEAVRVFLFRSAGLVPFVFVIGMLVAMGTNRTGIFFDLWISTALATAGCCIMLVARNCLGSARFDGRCLRLLAGGVSVSLCSSWGFAICALTWAFPPFSWRFGAISPRALQVPMILVVFTVSIAFLLAGAVLIAGVLLRARPGGEKVEAERTGGSRGAEGLPGYLRASIGLVTLLPGALLLYTPILVAWSMVWALGHGEAVSGMAWIRLGQLLLPPLVAVVAAPVVSGNVFAMLGSRSTVT